MSFIPQSCTPPPTPPLDIDGSQGISITGAGTDADPYIVSAIIDSAGGNALSVGPAGLLAGGGGPSHLYFGADSWYPGNGNVIINGNFSMAGTTFTNGGGTAFTRMEPIPADWNTVDVFLYWVNADTSQVDWNLFWFFGTAGAAFPFGASGQTFSQPFTIGANQRLNKTLLITGLVVPGGDMLRLNLTRGSTDPSGGNQVVMGLDVVKTS